jgi:hypothetical protein
MADTRKETCMTTVSIHKLHPASGLRRQFKAAVNAAPPVVFCALAGTVVLASVVIFRVLAFFPT